MHLPARGVKLITSSSPVQDLRGRVPTVATVARLVAQASEPGAHEGIVLIMPSQRRTGPALSYVMLFCHWQVKAVETHEQSGLGTGCKKAIHDSLVFNFIFILFLSFYTLIYMC